MLNNLPGTIRQLLKHFSYPFARAHIRLEVNDPALKFAATGGAHGIFGIGQIILIIFLAHGLY
jgi:hypothetical protein